jgi:5-(carboxyamino)imidazole ribonucleotide mutase
MPETKKSNRSTSTAPRRTKSEPRTKARRVAEEADAAPRVSIVMGSDSDWPTMEPAATVLKEFGVVFEADVVSAHRMPEQMVEFGRAAHERGIRVIIAGAGGAAHLPGMLAALTPLPVIGVPVPLAHLDGMDSLLSIVQMPGGVPVATVGIGNAKNAGLLAVRILAAGDPDLIGKMLAFQDNLRATAQAKGEKVRQFGQG